MEKKPTKSATVEICKTHHKPGQKGKGELESVVCDVMWKSNLFCSDDVMFYFWQLEEAEEVLGHMRGKGGKPEAAVFNTLLSGLGKRGDAVHAFKVFNNVSDWRLSSGPYVRGRVSMVGVASNSVLRARGTIPHS